MSQVLRVSLDAGSQLNRFRVSSEGAGSDSRALAIGLKKVKQEEIEFNQSNHLVILKPGVATPVTYWAGFAWDRAGQITSAESWKSYIDQFEKRLISD